MLGLAVLVGIVTSRDIDFIVEKKDEGASIVLRYPYTLLLTPSWLITNIASLHTIPRSVKIAGYPYYVAEQVRFFYTHRIGMV
jgi:hypothetical protein